MNTCFYFDCCGFAPLEFRFDFSCLNEFQNETHPIVKFSPKFSFKNGRLSHSVGSISFSLEFLLISSSKLPSTVCLVPSFSGAWETTSRGHGIVLGLGVKKAELIVLLQGDNAKLSRPVPQFARWRNGMQLRSLLYFLRVPRP